MKDFSLNRIALVIAALTTLLVLGACGAGSSEESTSSPKTSSLEQTAKTGFGDTAKGEKGKLTDASRGEAQKGSSGGRAGEVGSGNPDSAQKNQEGSKRRHRTRLETLDESLRALVGGTHGGQRILSSDKKIRQILKELQEGSDEGSKPDSGTSIDQVIEQALGDR